MYLFLDQLKGSGRRRRGRSAAVLIRVMPSGMCGRLRIAGTAVLPFSSVRLLSAKDVTANNHGGKGHERVILECCANFLQVAKGRKSQLKKNVSPLPLSPHRDRKSASVLASPSSWEKISNTSTRYGVCAYQTCRVAFPGRGYRRLDHQRFLPCGHDSVQPSYIRC